MPIRPRDILPKKATLAFMIFKNFGATCRQLFCEGVVWDVLPEVDKVLVSVPSISPRRVYLPVDYLTCNAAAFTFGDRVLIYSPQCQYSRAKVVGFAQPPRSCGGSGIIYTRSWGAFVVSLVDLGTHFSVTQTDAPTYAKFLCDLSGGSKEVIGAINFNGVLEWNNIPDPFGGPATFVALDLIAHTESQEWVQFLPDFGGPPLATDITKSLPASERHGIPGTQRFRNGATDPINPGSHGVGWYEFADGISADGSQNASVQNFDKHPALPLDFFVVSPAGSPYLYMILIRETVSGFTITDRERWVRIDMRNNGATLEVLAEWTIVSGSDSTSYAVLPLEEGEDREVYFYGNRDVFDSGTSETTTTWGVFNGNLSLRQEITDIVFAGDPDDPSTAPFDVVFVTNRRWQVIETSAYTVGNHAFNVGGGKIFSGPELVRIDLETDEKTRVLLFDTADGYGIGGPSITFDLYAPTTESGEFVEPGSLVWSGGTKTTKLGHGPYLRLVDVVASSGDILFVAEGPFRLASDPGTRRWFAGLYLIDSTGANLRLVSPMLLRHRGGLIEKATGDELDFGDAPLLDPFEEGFYEAFFHFPDNGLAAPFPRVPDGGGGFVSDPDAMQALVDTYVTREATDAVDIRTVGGGLASFFDTEGDVVIFSGLHRDDTEFGTEYEHTPTSTYNHGFNQFSFFAQSGAASAGGLMPANEGKRLRLIGDQLTSDSSTTDIEDPTQTLYEILSDKPYPIDTTYAKRGLRWNRDLAPATVPSTVESTIQAALDGGSDPWEDVRVHAVIGIGSTADAGLGPEALNVPILTTEDLTIQGNVSKGLRFLVRVTVLNLGTAPGNFTGFDDLWEREGVDYTASFPIEAVLDSPIPKYLLGRDRSAAVLTDTVALSTRPGISFAAYRLIVRPNAALIGNTYWLKMKAFGDDPSTPEPGDAVTPNSYEIPAVVVQEAADLKTLLISLNTTQASTDQAVTVKVLVAQKLPGTLEVQERMATALIQNGFDLKIFAGLTDVTSQYSRIYDPGASDALIVPDDRKNALLDPATQREYTFTLIPEPGLATSGVRTIVGHLEWKDANDFDQTIFSTDETDVSGTIEIFQRANLNTTGNSLAPTGVYARNVEVTVTTDLVNTGEVRALIPSGDFIFISFWKGGEVTPDFEILEKTVGTNPITAPGGTGDISIKFKIKPSAPDGLVTLRPGTAYLDGLSSNQLSVRTGDPGQAANPQIRIETAPTFRMNFQSVPATVNVRAAAAGDPFSWTTGFTNPSVPLPDIVGAYRIDALNSFIRILDDGTLADETSHYTIAADSGLPKTLLSGQSFIQGAVITPNAGAPTGLKRILYVSGLPAPTGLHAVYISTGETILVDITVFPAYGTFTATLVP